MRRTFAVVVVRQGMSSPVRILPRRYSGETERCRRFLKQVNEAVGEDPEHARLAVEVWNLTSHQAVTPQQVPLQFWE